MALDAKNDIFNADQKVITIIEDESDDDDDEEVNEKKTKTVTFRSTAIDGNIKKNNKYSKKESNYNIKKLKGKSKIQNNDLNIEMANMKEENDFIEIDDNQDQSNKYKYNFNYKNNPSKSNIKSFRENSSYSHLELINEVKKIDNKKKIIKKQTMHERFKKNVKEQKSRHIYSILDKALNDIKNTGQNSLETSSKIIKRPSSLIGISNALNRVNNKEEEKILIKNEFFVIFKLILYILYQYEYRFIALFNDILLPITRNNIICLLCFRLNIQLSVCIILTPRYYGNNYSFSKNILSIIASIIISDIIYTILEIILMKKKISTSTDNKEKGIIKFKQIIDCIFGYVIIIALFLLGLYNSLWVSLYLREYNIKCHYLINYVSIILLDYIFYESLVLSLKSLIFTYVVYQDSQGCILKIMEILNFIFDFILEKYILT